MSYRHWEGVHALGVSDHGLAGVTRSGSVVSVISDHERQGLRGCRTLGFVVSHIISDHERNGAGHAVSYRRGEGVHALGSPIIGWRVPRGPGPWSPVISDHERRSDGG